MLLNPPLRQAANRWQKRHWRFGIKTTILNIVQTWILKETESRQNSLRWEVWIHFLSDWKNADENFQKRWLNGIFNDYFWQLFRELLLDSDKKLLDKILPNKKKLLNKICSEHCATEKKMKIGGLTSKKRAKNNAEKSKIF